ncbi:putative sulfate/molybdate transporter [Halofilum ochraceum]|uniref:putative sulfate/molybdate transporter n=1 Tax=Halofilum ochraceum TaxID=1611323 RepID=UPI0008D932C7|nr:putative sulfate/molybdate transporter [Halofilum ochraceum]
MSTTTRQPHPLRELAGACGDLGTFLPLTIGAIMVGGLPAGSVLAGFGIAYLLTAGFYRAPIPVQPMKVAGAVLVTTAPAVEAVIGGGLVLAIVFLLLGSGDLIARLARLVPAPVIAALQAGLGLSLGWKALGMLAATPLVGFLLAALAAVLLLWRPQWPVALIVLGASLAAVPWIGGAVPAAAIPAAGLIPPHLPGIDALITGVVLIALPQFPLTLTNAIMVTERVGREYYPDAHRVRMRRLSLTTGLMNLVTAPFGALPMCHGAGGVAAHYRFGARTWRAPAGLGVALLGLGLFAAADTTRLLAQIPDAALGTLLLIPAIDLVRIVRPAQYAPTDQAFIVVLGAIAIVSPALAFVIGMIAIPLWYRFRGTGSARGA